MEPNNMEVVKQNCIFCKMTSGEIQSYKIYEDEICMGILDINPSADGHILIVPKEHYMIMNLVPDDILNKLGIVIKNQIQALKEILNCQDVRVFIANGAAAGQQSNHFLIHLIPKYEQENIEINIKEETNTSELEEVFKKLKINLKQK